MVTPTTLLQRLEQDLKTAMRARESGTLATLRQIKSRVQEALNKEPPEAAREPDDDYVQEIIFAYCKALDKAVGEMARAGDKSQHLRDSYAAEIAFLARYLPAKFDAEKIRSLAVTAAKELGVSGAAHAGRIMGMLMKKHPKQIDSAAARNIISEVLGGLS